MLVNIPISATFSIPSVQHIIASINMQAITEEFFDLFNIHNTGNINNGLATHHHDMLVNIPISATFSILSVQHIIASINIQVIVDEFFNLVDIHIKFKRLYHFNKIY